MSKLIFWYVAATGAVIFIAVTLTDYIHQAIHFPKTDPEQEGQHVYCTMCTSFFEAVKLPSGVLAWMELDEDDVRDDESAAWDHS